MSTICGQLLTLSNFGLFLDIIGASLLFFYTPMGLFMKKDGSHHSDYSEEKIKKAKLGYIFLLLGFVLQMIGNIF